MHNETVTILINGQAHIAQRGVCLGSFLTDHHAGLPMPCGGHGRCGKCRVTVTGAVSPVSEAERRLLSPEELARGIRLACLTMAEGDCTVSTAEENAHRICADGEMPEVTLRPAFTAYGAAVDIGTTTLAARLHDTDGTRLAETTAMNPQSAWGADVISRIEASLRGENRELAASVRQAVDGMLRTLAEKAGIDAAQIDALVITGNTAMLHLLTDTSPEPLSHAPFRAERLFGETLPASALDLSAAAADTPVYLPPCIGAFVGADTSTALLSTQPDSSDKTRMLVDIGTNGEMVLWNGETMLACSTAAGPAFEGAGISMGMSGSDGAVDHVTVVNGALHAHVIGGVSPVGICGSGIVDAVAGLLDIEELDETGFLEDDEAMVADPVVLTQEDIRMVQLAKSAIHAGIRTLLSTAKTDCDQVDELLIAGGFGSYLDVKNAGRIGLLPEELIPRVRVIGNAALSGASMLLLDRNLREDCARHARNARLVDLSANPVFTNEYMERMLF